MLLKTLELILLGLGLILPLGCSEQIGHAGKGLGLHTVKLEDPGPFEITSVTTGDKVVDLDWSLSANSLSYTIKYRLISDPTFITASTSPSKPFHLSGLTNGLTYEVVIVAHNTEGIVETLPVIFSPSVSPVTAPVTQTINEDTQGIVTLSYTDADGDLATLCAISNLSHVTVTQVCSCIAGVCSVGITGTANYNGPASFDFTVTAGGAISQASTASLTITPVDDPPLTIPLTPAAFNEDVQSIITLPYTDVEGHTATSCSITLLTNITETLGCSCTLGVCTVGVTGTANYYGTAGFEYTVTANGLTSNSSPASLTISPVNDAPVANNITPGAFNEDTQSSITLSYTDIESDEATSCSITAPTNITVTTPCACAAGICTVGVTGTLNYHGAASFNYTVLAGVVSNSATATLTISPVDDAPVAVNITPSDLSIGVQSVITLSYTDVESDMASSCALSHLVNLTITQACSCSVGTCTVGVTSSTSAASSFNYTVTANSLTSNSASATFSANLSCPVGYIDVPANLNLGTKKFCVMQFEARETTFESEPSALPAHSISITDAKNACTSKGSEYDLISNAEWMTIARNIEGVNSNWTGGIVEVGSLFMGTTEFAWPALNISDVNDPYDQTGKTPADVPGVEQRRTYTLSNGKTIWDFSGNLSEWVDMSSAPGFQGVSSSCIGTYMKLFENHCSDLVDEQYRPHMTTFTALENFGFMEFDYDSAVVARGSSNNDGSKGGPYSMLGKGDPTYAYSYIGFRCVYRPSSGDTAPVAYNRKIEYSTLADYSLVKLPYHDPDQNLATTCNVSNLINTTVVEACACTNGECSLKVKSTATGIGSFNYTVTANGLTSNSATITSQVFVCPDGYISVPGNLNLGVNDFCVMKYEGKAGKAYPTSTPEGLPASVWDSQCSYLDKPYGHISNLEWMTLARNIENNPNNWTGGAVGSGKIFSGHSDNSPATGLEVTDVNDPYNGTGNAIGSDQRRTLHLSNGEVIWDLTGNYHEYVDWSNVGNAGIFPPRFCGYKTGSEYPTFRCSEIATEEYSPANTTFASTNGAGKYYNDGDMGKSIYRGGAFTTTVASGLYTAQQISTSLLGNRCVYRPMKNFIPTVAFNISPDISKGLSSNVTLRYKDPDGEKATSCSVFGLNNVTVDVPCNCEGGLCSVGIVGTTVGPGSFLYTVKTKSGIDSNPATANFTVTTCPYNYILVPGNSALGTGDFCVMKYEARKVSAGELQAVSTNIKEPWDFIQPTEIQSKCTVLGTGFDLISNPEWMTIARNAENVPANWSSNIVGTGCMWQGNIAATSTCSYDGPDPMDFGEVRNTKARLTLSNGEEIWDFAGNATEYVDYSMAPGMQTFPTTCASNNMNVTCAGLTPDAHKTNNPALTSAHGIGRISSTAGTYIARGSLYNATTTNAGLYAIQPLVRPISPLDSDVFIVLQGAMFLRPLTR